MAWKQNGGREEFKLSSPFPSFSHVVRNALRREEPEGATGVARSRLNGYGYRLQRGLGQGCLRVSMKIPLPNKKVLVLRPNFLNGL